MLDVVTVTVSCLLLCRMVARQSHRMQLNSQKQVEWTRQSLATALATGARINIPRQTLSIVNRCCQLLCGRVIESECAVSVLPGCRWLVKPSVVCVVISSRRSLARSLCIYLYICQWHVGQFSHVGHILFLVVCTHTATQFVVRHPFWHILLPVASAYYCSVLARFYF